MVTKQSLFMKDIFRISNLRERWYFIRDVLERTSSIRRPKIFVRSTAFRLTVAENRDRALTLRRDSEGLWWRTGTCRYISPDGPVVNSRRCNYQRMDFRGKSADCAFPFPSEKTYENSIILPLSSFLKSIYLIHSFSLVVLWCRVSCFYAISKRLTRTKDISHRFL